MKQHHYLWVACVALMAACTSEIDLGEEIQESEGVTSLNVLNDRRSYGEALEVARGAVAMLDQEEALPQRSVTKKQKRQVDLSGGVKCITGEKRVIQRGGEPVVVDDTLMYVFNYDNNQGYALVSTNLATEPLIAVTEQGHLDPSQETDNPGLKLYLEMAKQYVAKTKHIDSISIQQNLMERIPNKYRRRYDTLQRTRVLPKIAVKWGQTYPEGWACPNQCSGCINTACAQIMSYYGYPTAMALTYYGAPTSVISINWADLRTHINHLDIYNYVDTCNPSIHYKISYICRQLGELSGSVYYTNPSITGASMNGARNSLLNMGYSLGSTMNYYSSSTLETELANNRLILMSGDDNTTSVGHAWVVDGCDYYNVRYREYMGIPEETLLGTISYNWILLQDITTTYKYNHINWGWDGYDNGYYSNGVFSPINYAKLDDVNLHDTISADFCNNIDFFTVYHE